MSKDEPKQIAPTHQLTKLENGEWATTCYVCKSVYMMSELMLCEHTTEGVEDERVYLCDACLEMCGS